MNAAKSLLPPTSAAQCADWIKPSQLAAFARAASDLALMSLQPPPGEPFVPVDGQRASDRGDYAEYIVEAFRVMVYAHAHRAGMAGFEQFERQLMGWQAGLAAQADVSTESGVLQ